MVFAYLFIAHALNATQVDYIELPVRHSRASKMLERLRPLFPTDPREPVTFTADDARGLILARGDLGGIEWIRKTLEMFDVSRRQISVRLSIDSPIDKQSYEVSAKILNQQEWKTSDGDTGVNCAVTPRLNDDGTITIFSEFGSTEGQPSKFVVRLKAGGSTSVVIGNSKPKVFSPKTDGLLKDWVAKQTKPVVTILVNNSEN